MNKNNIASECHLLRFDSDFFILSSFYPAFYINLHEGKNVLNNVLIILMCYLTKCALFTARHQGIFDCLIYFLGVSSIHNIQEDTF